MTPVIKQAYSNNFTAGSDLRLPEKFKSTIGLFTIFKFKYA